jgi:hypothetical protein
MSIDPTDPAKTNIKDVLIPQILLNRLKPLWWAVPTLQMIFLGLELNIYLALGEKPGAISI